MAVTVDPKALQLADIIITDSSKFVSHCGIVAGTNRVNTVKGYVNRPEVIYHATRRGILHDEASMWAGIAGPSSVFRLRALRNLSQGSKPAGAVIAEKAIALSTRCVYGKGRAFFKSWTGTSSYGDGARGRVAKYLQRLGNGNGCFVTTLYCSEYVVLSYQLAAKGDEGAAYFIDLDGKHTLPKDLRNWLLSRCTPGGTWSYVGDLR